MPTTDETSLNFTAAQNVDEKRPVWRLAIKRSGPSELSIDRVKGGLISFDVAAVTSATEVTRHIMLALGVDHALPRTLTTGGHRFDPDALYKHMKNVYGWDKATVDAQLLCAVPVPTPADGFTAYDPLSIMVTHLDASCYADGRVPGKNTRLSQQDLYLLRRLYPFKPQKRAELAGHAVAKRTFIDAQTDEWKQVVAHANFLFGGINSAAEVEPRVTQTFHNSTIGKNFSNVTLAPDQSLDLDGPTIGSVEGGTVVGDSKTTIGKVKGGHVDLTGASGNVFHQHNEKHVHHHHHHGDSPLSSPPAYSADAGDSKVGGDGGGKPVGVMIAGRAVSGPVIIDEIRGGQHDFSRPGSNNKFVRHG